jgi:SAM-dependent methyltransferase
MIKCRICHQSATSPSFTALNTHGRSLVNGQTFPVYFCSNCQAYFLDGVENNPNYYSDSYPENYYIVPNFIIWILSSFNFFRINLVLSQFPKGKKIDILDIGCGKGEFLESLPNDRFIKSGLEINPEGVKLAAAKGLDIISADINKYEPKDRQYDCITLWHVLEHLPNPGATIKMLHTMLKPGGVLILDTPNSRSFGFKFGKTDYFHLDSPRHLYIPNPTNLTFMLEKADFSKYSFSNSFYDYPLDLFWSLRNSLLKFIVYPLYPLFKAISSETLLTVARK